MANRYGLRGALFPLVLFPKISDPTNPYKSYIAEFASLRSAIRDRMRVIPGTHFHLRTHVFLLMLFPWTFVLPAAWRQWRSSHMKDVRFSPSTSSWWVAGWVLACGLSLVVALGMPSPKTKPWLVQMSRVQPIAVLVKGGWGAALVFGRSRTASVIVAVGAAAVAAWALWLRVSLFEPMAELPANKITMLPYLAAFLGVVTAFLVIRAGGSLFRLLLTAAFTYLSFQAVRNVNLFGLVMGTVLASITTAQSLLPLARMARTRKIALTAKNGSFSRQTRRALGPTQLSGPIRRNTAISSTTSTTGNVTATAFDSWAAKNNNQAVTIQPTRRLSAASSA
jgi:hypothetical protein